MKTTDKEREDAISLRLAKGYRKKISKIGEKEGLRDRPQIIEFLIDHYLKEEDYEAEKERIEEDIRRHDIARKVMVKAVDQLKIKIETEKRFKDAEASKKQEDIKKICDSLSEYFKLKHTPDGTPMSKAYIMNIARKRAKAHDLPLNELVDHVEKLYLHI